MKIYLETPRLLLRAWKEEDLSPFAQMNSDDHVMEYFLAKLSEAETLAYYQRIQEELRSSGFGLYAVEEKESHNFMGYIGLHTITFDVDFAPAVELGWRLLPEYWNQGYATEGAAACLDYALNSLLLPKVVAFTALPNQPSQRVMQKIGLTHIKDFNHPLVDPNHPLCRHVLYGK